jgi:XRE family aerobic/anaerobic benzoate catabolism transcriptional regulator
MSAADLLLDRPEVIARAEALLGGLSARQQIEAVDLLARHFGAADVPGRGRRIALLGLRGAGKSTLGRMLAAAMEVPFHELDRDIERLAGTTLPEIFELHGQSGFRRLEREALDALVAGGDSLVIATGGGIVATAATYDLLLRSCRTVWIRATPEEHMRRVVAQGDMRPMHDTANAMGDLRAILASREPLYAQAELQFDTTGQEPGESVAALRRLLGG